MPRTNKTPKVLDEKALATKDRELKKIEGQINAASERLGQLEKTRGKLLKERALLFPKDVQDGVLLPIAIIAICNELGISAEPYLNKYVGRQ